MSKRLPNPWQEVILVRHGAVIIKFNSNLVIFFDIFGISISGINRNANTLILLNIDILQSPNNNYYIIFCVCFN